MKRLLLTLAFLLLPSQTFAQLAPIAATTVQTTNTGAESLKVGCAVGSSTCTGGIKAGAIDASGTMAVTGTTTLSSSLTWGTSIAAPGVVTDRGRCYYNTVTGLTCYGAGSTADVTLLNKNQGVALEVLTGTQNVRITGLLSSPALGTHLLEGAGVGSTNLRVRNGTAGAANFASVQIAADGGTFSIFQLSSTFTPTGANFANGARLDAAVASATGGLTLSTSGGGPIHLFPGGATTEYGRMHASGGFSWGDTTDPGANNFRVAGTSALVGLVTATAGVSFGGANSQLLLPSNDSQSITCDGATESTLLAYSKVLRVTTGGSGACLIKGIDGGTDGETVFIINATGQTMTFNDEDASEGTAANRLALPSNLLYGVDSIALAWYDATSSRWRLIL